MHCTYQIPIKSFISETDEIMHGVGIHSSSHTVNHNNNNGEAEYFGACESSVKLAKKQAEVD